MAATRTAARPKRRNGGTGRGRLAGNAAVGAALVPCAGGGSGWKEIPGPASREGSTALPDNSLSNSSDSGNAVARVKGRVKCSAPERFFESNRPAPRRSCSGTIAAGPCGLSLLILGVRGTEIGSSGRAKIFSTSSSKSPPALDGLRSLSRVSSMGRNNANRVIRPRHRGGPQPGDEGAPDAGGCGGPSADYSPVPQSASQGRAGLTG